MRAPRRSAAPAAQIATADDSRAIAAVPALPAPEEPKAIDWDALIDEVNAQPPPTSTPEIEEYIPSFVVSETARAWLEDLGCPSADINACTCRADLDGLFDIWKDRPPVRLIAALKRHGCTDFSRIPTKAVAKALLTRLKNTKPATPAQKEYINVLQRRANINKPIPEGLTEASASTMITTLIKTTPATVAQTNELRRLGVDEALVRPPLFFSPVFHHLFILMTLHFPISIPDPYDQIP